MFGRYVLVDSQMTSLSSALSGMNRAAGDLDDTARRVARAGHSAPDATATPSSADSDGDSVNLSSDMVSLLNSRNNFEANTKTAEVSDQITQSTIHMLG